MFRTGTPVLRQAVAVREHSCVPVYCRRMTDDKKHILVLGAGGATGRHVVEDALRRGWRVRAADRSTGGIPDDDGVEAREVNVLRDDLSPLVEGTDAIISALGVSWGPRNAVDPPPLYTETVRRLIPAMRKTGTTRLVVISASFVQTLDNTPLWFRAAAGVALKQILDGMRRMESLLVEADDLDWTAVRPGWLMEGEATDDAEIAADVIPEGTFRTRHADLARFMLDCVETGAWVRRTPAIARKEPEADSGPAALLKEMFERAA